MAKPIETSPSSEEIPLTPPAERQVPDKANIPRGDFASNDGFIVIQQAETMDNIKTKDYEVEVVSENTNSAAESEQEAVSETEREAGAETKESEAEAETEMPSQPEEPPQSETREEKRQRMIAEQLRLSEERKKKEEEQREKEREEEEERIRQHAIFPKPENLPENVKIGMFTSKKVPDCRIYTRQWLPEQQPLGLLYICHGFAEHISRYDDIASKFVADNLLVFGHDHAGHGRSEGDRANIDDYYNYVADVCHHIHVMTSIYEDLPLFTWGHAMGACISITIGRSFPDLFKGMVFTAPLVMPDPLAATPFKRLLARTITKIAPKMDLGKVDTSALSRDKDEVKKYIEDPLIYHGGYRMKWATELMNGTIENHENLEEFDVPFLAMHGTLDDLVLPMGAKELYDRCGTLDKTLQFYKNFYHELHHEPPKDAEIIINMIRSWIGDRLGNSAARRIILKEKNITNSHEDISNSSDLLGIDQEETVEGPSLNNRRKRYSSETDVSNS